MSFFSAIKNFFVTAPKQESTVESAPYKVPEPVAPAATKKPAPKKPAAPKKPVAAKSVVRKPRAPKV